MASVIYRGSQGERATETGYLEKRLEINRSYSSMDFDGWLFERLQVQAGEHVLDVGCGTGSQTIPFASLVGPSGSVSSLDIAASSIALLRERVPPDARVNAVASDMGDLADIIATTFETKRYSLAHSSYALYYSPKRLDVLGVMRGALKPGGRCAVFTPDMPHDLVALAEKFSDIPPAVNESLRFGSEVLQPYFAKNFSRVETHHFHNLVSVPSTDILIEFYRQTTYYDETAEAKIRAYVDDEIKKNGRFDYEKNGLLLIGHIDE